MTKTLNTILLKRFNKVSLPPFTSFEKEPEVDEILNSIASVDKQVYIAGVLKEVTNNGYVFSKNVVEALLTMELEDLKVFSEDIINSLKYLIGEIDYQPIYKNFPEGIEENYEEYNFINFLYYFFGIKPQSEQVVFSPLDEKIDYKVIDVAEESIVSDLLINLSYGKAALSESDREDLIFLLNSDLVDSKLITKSLNEKIPFKDTMVLIVSTLLKHNKVSNTFLENHFANPKDLFNYLVFTHPYYGKVDWKLSNSEKNFILRTLNSMNSLAESMDKNRTDWIKIGELIHPGTKRNRKKYPKTAKAFDTLRNVKIVKFNGRVDQAFMNEDFTLALHTLMERPTDFGRNFVRLITNFPEQYERTLIGYRTIAKDVSTPVLLTLLNQFRNILLYNENRFVSIKDKLVRLHSNEKLMELRGNILDQVINDAVLITEQALESKFILKEELGKVFIEDGLKNISIPISQGASSEVVNPMTTGSRIELSTSKNICRAFVQWTNFADIDLSATIFDENFNVMRFIAWNSDHSYKGIVNYSGDERGRSGVEYMDINIKEAKAEGISYLLLRANSFSSLSFSTNKLTKAGLMMRESGKTGKQFEPSTAENVYSVTNDSTNSNLFILDLTGETPAIIWLDTFDGDSSDSFVPNAASTQLSAISSFVKRTVMADVPSLFDLYYAHALSRGVYVDSEELADTVFKAPTKQDKLDIPDILNNYL